MSEPTDGSAVKQWKEETTAFDRVQSVAQTLDQPRPSKYISKEAAVAETTANDHLKRLSDLGVVRVIGGETARLYEPDPLYLRFQTLRRFLDEHDHDELIEKKAVLQQRIEGWEDEYDVESPEELREMAGETDSTAETVEIRKTASDWGLAAYHLSVIDDAIRNYTEYTALDQ